MNISKKNRQIIFNKYQGKCAYCGCYLEKIWHVDHIEPMFRGYGSAITGKINPHPERHCMENFNPSCPVCNRSKATYTLDQWRERLKQHVVSFNLYHPTYRLAKAYGLIQETGAEVKFYFETLN